MSTRVIVKAEFLGGLDSIFGGIKETKCTVEANDSTLPTIKDLIKHITDHLLVSPNDYCVFIQEDTVRPGILVLINDTDWELEGELDYELESGDVVTFTSTLHGG
ncbi:DEKNAAC104760 [Brettanomyces naardenensis]|uniref:Ubiquitin-related modifier 1 n=1 Tax=Brettanomyces naardenensis TaxID=13370 RepID=A0A448YRK4_BRENA|nr:DEKNAAC104760 [Brettanomyces naardenensis]